MPRRPRLWVLLFCFAAVPAWAGDAPPAGKGAVLRVGLAGAPERGSREAIEAALRAAGAAVEEVRLPSTDRKGYSRMDAVILAGSADGGDDSLATLETAVEEGVGLVVLGDASAMLPDSPRARGLLGRKRVVVPEAGDGLVLEVVNQSHPITQCVTHLFLPATRALATAGIGAVELGRSLPAGAKPAPRAPGETGTKASAAAPDIARDTVLWTGLRGKGRIAVLALRGGSPAEEEALAFLGARMAEWASGREVSVPIPAKLPLAALRLGPKDAGSLPGMEPEPGFHRGREIAPVMGWQAIEWLLRPDREATELPDKVLDALRIEEGSTVADVGAGAGYFTLRLARRVGPRGRVIATDIQEEMLAALRERLERESATNVDAVLATETDARLPEGGVDLVLMVDVYHELSEPHPTASSVLRSLRARGERGGSGRLALVEYRGEDPAVPIKPLHRMTELQARAELEPLGFRWKETHGFLPHQHVIVFERP